ncbi:MAG: hypothetical protein R3B70_24185 [Polyangiaceae bacterium]
MRTSWIGACVVGLALTLPLAAGCNRNKGEDASAEPQAAGAQAALVEERDEGKLEWVVEPDGAVRVKVTPNEGTVPVTGALLIEGESFALSGEDGSLAATGPKLTAELTTITYSLKVGDSTWEGALHVPPGGTADLVAAPSVTVPEGTKGPNGGVVDVVGDQRVEMVVDEKTGEVRVYLLDENLQPIPVGDATAVAAFAQQEAQQ